jgi:hypothetical protein
MHIVILHYAAPPIVGGVEHVIYYHATLLAVGKHSTPTWPSIRLTWSTRATRISWH